MTDIGREKAWQSDKAVEELLGKATPRPVPPAAEADAVRQAVHAEWLRVAGRRRRGRRLMSLAVAASVLVAVFVGLNSFRINGVDEVQVAVIGKRFGSIFVLGENAELLAGNELGSVVAGQTLVTDKKSGIGLAWANGGSLRIDENTRVQFRSPESIYLRSGRIYFDSNPALSENEFRSVRVSALRIETDYGTVTHLGTQYMTSLQGERLTVSVRDGQVLVRNAKSAAQAGGGEQLAIEGSGSPSVVNFRRWGEAWHWIENVAPEAKLDGRTVSEFLSWVSQETGLEVRFESDGARNHALNERLKGVVNTGPRDALRFWMLGTDLTWRIDDGVIYVSET